ncbi:hypothetical protein COV49_04075 [Candidatus Falkowbacteria bacterium CG11_big_fil_rev_8_21_14_0_20_39_10]|uniref:Colicin V production protein n=1 Tax=Candidatus Falkowbacteria bacterium CG11_big_fil_rev_8_21_14_0_20_39_10 TaxID=1974570 RepID=A0A2M6K8A0_9BACT|nr:MAG: hypothetical protein COV49_04075 [Candidatus Falkowbacteria bacterium CG11_big_fil_rev_8_21_14_0_20_39_10]
MGLFDIILIIILAGFVFYGLFFGLIRTLGTLTGTVAGAWIAIKYHLLVFSWFQGLFFGFDNLGRVIIFILLFTLTHRLVLIIFAILDKTFNIISIIPFLKSINRLLGAIFGFILGSFVVGLIIYGALSYPYIPGFTVAWINKSQVVPFLMKFIKILLPILPSMLEKLKNLV